MKTIVFLGGGSIASSIIAGLHRAGHKARLVAYDKNPEKPKKLRRQFGIGIARTLREAVTHADVLIIAVRPDNVAALLGEIRSLVPARLDQKRRAAGQRTSARSACSLAAGIPLKRLRAALPKTFYWARAMPSPTSHSGYGLTALCFESRFPESQKAIIKNLFGALGPAVKIPERQFDAFTAIYSCTHGYHALAVLAGAGLKAGLDRKTALLAAAHALADGIQVWRNGDSSLDELIKEATTPGGIAASVIRVMDRHGYARIVENGLLAGIARAHQNADK